MSITTLYRSEAPEIMDDFAMEGIVLSEALDKIASINQLLGGNKITITAVEKLLATHDKSRMLTIIDIGCGNGDMLRKISDFGIQNDFIFHLKGIDANQFTIDYAKKISELYPNIVYSCINILDKSFEDQKYDIALLTLTLHHFSNDEIISILSKVNKTATIGIVINDLHRSKIAYRLFQLLCKIFRLNHMTEQDGLTSILRGFKKQELVNFSNKLQFKNDKIQWKWAFRYQWIVTK